MNEYEVVEKKEIASEVVAMYSFVLNTPEYRNREMTGKEFANRISEVFDCSEYPNKYATVVAEDYIASIRYELSGRVVWKFTAKEV